RQSLRAFDLRNDLVAPSLDTEPIDVVPADQRRKILTGFPEIDTLRSQFVSIEDDFGLRLIELQIGVGEDEQTARERLLYELGPETHKLLRLSRRGNHEVDWEISATGQGRRRLRNRADARNLRQRAHRFDKQVLCGLGSLAPRFRHHTAEARGRKRELEDAGRLRE